MTAKKKKPEPVSASEIYETLKMGFIPDKFCSSFSPGSHDGKNLTGPSTWRRQLSQYLGTRQKHTPIQEN